MSSEPQPRRPPPRGGCTAPGILVLAVDALRDAALPMLVVGVVAITGGGLDADALVRALMFAAIGAAVAAIAGTVTWSTTTWALTAGTVRLRTGVLSTKVVDIPLPRVQSVDTVRGPIQRLFGVQGVHIQTAGGGKEGEIKLVALATADVEALRAAVGDDPAGGRGARRSPRSCAGSRPARCSWPRSRRARSACSCPCWRRCRSSSTSSRAATSRTRAARARGSSPTRRRNGCSRSRCCSAIAWLLAILGAIAAFSGFQVARHDDRLRLRRGLVARRESTVAVPRVQAVLVVEGVLRRPFGLATLRVEVAGFRAEAAAAQTLFPLLRRRDVPGFLAELLPEHADGLDGLAPPPPRAWRRYVLPPALAGLALGAAGWIAIPGAGPWPLAARAPGRRAGRPRAAGRRLAAGGRPARDALAPAGADHGAGAGRAAAGGGALAVAPAAARPAGRPRRRRGGGHAGARPPPRRGRGRRGLRRVAPRRRASATATGSGRTMTVSATGTISSAGRTAASACARSASALSAS